MADKKKKMFISKELSTPRRPVILKSDRESKDKVEKEEKKQPTIILKTREQSNPKDDASSTKDTKSQSSEEAQHPCKIAQNENKEKKSIESKPVPPLKLMTTPVKLLDENLEFNPAALEFLQDSNSNYLVVGVVGTQGVGKSMIANLITLKNTTDLCAKILQSHEISSGQFDSEFGTVEKHMSNLSLSNNVKQKYENNFKFKMQDMEQIERGVHCTKGVDMFVTSDRVILLDCQAICAPSLIEETNTNPVSSRSANIVTVDCLQVTSFLMAICHVLIAVQDWFADYNFIRYIQSAEMLKPSCSASSSVPLNQDGSESTSTGESLPHLLLLHNRCQLEDYTVDAVKTMQEFYKKAFLRSNLQMNSGMYLYSDTNKNGLNVDKVCKNYDVENCGAPINLFLLPEIYQDYDNRDIYRGHPTFEELAKRLRWIVLGVNRHQITNVPNLSEKGWFQYCNKAWENIKKCTFFLEYERFLP